MENNLSLEALAEVLEEKRTPQTPPKTALPSLASLLADADALPQSALYLGLAEDGLPVLLNLQDPTPGPILITGDSASGKTALLKMIARGIDLLHSPTSAQYCIITNHTDEWKAFEGGKNSVGVYALENEGTSAILESLVEWARNNKSKQSSVILLLDGLDTAIQLGGLAEQNLRWLLLRGASRNVWPLITLNANQAEALQEWLAFFRTRLFGQILNAESAALLTGSQVLKVNDLIAGSQFSLREENQLLKFWVPLIE
ncbi:MAG: hypothetical protein IT310_00545 [Anaerolineales bacterium]|nr:hypothetical protein [Anaerolineales bacterium]